MGLINTKRSSNAAETKYTTLNGLYKTCEWDPKNVKKWIQEKKLAPLYPGQAEKTSRDLDECPICFLYYPGGLNRARCCKKEVCTECFLQIKKPNVKFEDSICPFCNRNKFTVIFSGPKTEQERQKEEREEQKVLELERKMREEEIEADKKREMERRKKNEQAAGTKGKERVTDSSKKNAANAATERESVEKLWNQQVTTVTATIKQKSKSNGAIDAGADAGSMGQNWVIIAKDEETISPNDRDLEEIMIREAIRLSLEGKTNIHIPVEEDDTQGSSSYTDAKSTLLSDDYGTDSGSSSSFPSLQRTLSSSSSAVSPPKQRVALAETPLGTSEESRSEDERSTEEWWENS